MGVMPGAHLPTGMTGGRGSSHGELWGVGDTPPEARAGRIRVQTSTPRPTGQQGHRAGVRSHRAGQGGPGVICCLSRLASGSPPGGRPVEEGAPKPCSPVPAPSPREETQPSRPPHPAAHSSPRRCPPRCSTATSEQPCPLLPHLAPGAGRAGPQERGIRTPHAPCSGLPCCSVPQGGSRQGSQGARPLPWPLLGHCPSHHLLSGGTWPHIHRGSRQVTGPRCPHRHCHQRTQQRSGRAAPG